MARRVMFELALVALAAVPFLGACGSSGAAAPSDGAVDGADAASDRGARVDLGDDLAQEGAAPADTTTNTDEGRGDAASDGPDASGNGAAGRDGAPGNDGGEAGTDVAFDGRSDLASDGSDGGGGLDADASSIVENEVVVLAVEARALVYDSTRRRLYASVDGDAATYANSIVVIDPAHDAVVSSIPIGSDPGPIALSDDGSTLWVGLREANAIRKITLPTATSPDPVVGPLIHVGIDRQKIYFFWPSSLVVLPGAPDSVVLAMTDGSQGPPNVVVLDSGVARPTAINMTNQGPETLVAGPPGVVFGFGSGGTFSQSVCSISQSGVSQMLYPSTLGGTTGVYLNNRLYTNSGQVQDVSDPLKPTLIGRSPGGAQAVRDAQHMMWAGVDATVTASQHPSALGLFDPITLQAIATASFTITDPPGDFVGGGEGVGALVYAGDDAAALTITDSFGPTRLAIVHSEMIRTPPAPPSSDGGLTDAGSDGGPTTGADGGLLPVAGTDGGLPPRPCAGCTFTAVPAYGGGVVYDGSRNLIYVTADSTAAANKNSLVTVDPVHGTVVSALPVGKGPGPLALSDDASTLWLGNTGDATVQRVTLGPPQGAGPSYVLPAAMPYSTTPSFATSLVVLPGSTSSIAASISGPEVLVLDDGVPRTTVFNHGVDAVGGLIRGPGSTLFGWNTYTTFGVLDVAASGISQTSFSALLEGTNLRSIVYSNGAVYGNDGTVIDVSVPSAPVPGGRIQYTANAIAVRDANHLLLLSDEGLSDDQAVYSSTPVLQVIDTRTLAVVGSAFFPQSALGSIPQLSQMTYLGGDAVAFMVYESYDSQLYIMHADVIGSPP